MQSNYNNNDKDVQIHIRKKDDKEADNLDHSEILLNNCNFEIFRKSFSLIAQIMNLSFDLTFEFPCDNKLYCRLSDESPKHENKSSV